MIRRILQFLINWSFLILKYHILECADALSPKCKNIFLFKLKNLEL